MSEVKSVFATLYAIDATNKVKEKSGLRYLPWASAWAEVKKVYPDATYNVIPQVVDDKGNTKFWHDDGKTGWVEVEVTIDGTTQKEILAIMDFKNKSIPADNITSADANKSVKRCLVKCLALFGELLHLYEGEEFPEEVTRIAELQAECFDLIAKKCKLSEKAKEKVAELCKNADPDANGDPRLIKDVEVLEGLKKQLLAVRK